MFGLFPPTCLNHWQQELESIDPFYIQQELKIQALSDQKKALKKAKKAQEKQKVETVAASLSNHNREAIAPFQQN